MGYGIDSAAYQAEGGKEAQEGTCRSGDERDDVYLYLFLLLLMMVQDFGLAKRSLYAVQRCRLERRGGGEGNYIDLCCCWLVVVVVCDCGGAEYHSTRSRGAGTRPAEEKGVVQVPRGGAEQQTPARMIGGASLLVFFGTER